MAPRAGQDRAVVVQSAAVLAGRAGGTDLSLGDLATHLGIRTPSLYNHIAGQDGLRRELALLGTRELAARLARATIGKAGDSAIYALATAYRAFAKERPGLRAASLRAPDPNDTAHTAVSAEIIMILQAVLNGYGLQDEATIHAIRAFRSMLHGFVALEMQGWLRATARSGSKLCAACTSVHDWHRPARNYATIVPRRAWLCTGPSQQTNQAGCGEQVDVPWPGAFWSNVAKIIKQSLVPRSSSGVKVVGRS